MCNWDQKPSQWCSSYAVHKTQNGVAMPLPLSTQLRQKFCARAGISCWQIQQGSCTELTWDQLSPIILFPINLIISLTPAGSPKGFTATPCAFKIHIIAWLLSNHLTLQRNYFYEEKFWGHACVKVIWSDLEALLPSPPPYQSWLWLLGDNGMAFCTWSKAPSLFFFTLKLSSEAKPW